MAHPREKFTLGTVGRFCRISGLTQIFLGLLTFGDIAIDAQYQFTSSKANEGARDFGRKDMAIFVSMKTIPVKHAVITKRFQIRFAFGGITRSCIDQIYGLTNEFLTCITIHGAGNFITIYDRPGNVRVIGIDQQNRIG
jgi:hypothetical protein